MQAIAHRIADRISSISVSSTMKVAADAGKLRSEGVDVVDFGAGEPDFPTPDNIKQAAIRALDAELHQVHARGRHRGAEEGRVRDATPRISAPPTSPASASSRWAASTSIFNLTQALINPGDEVVIPAPYWVTYKDVVNYAGGKCVFVDTDEANGFALTAAMMEPQPYRTHQDGDRQLALQSQRRTGGAGGVREDLQADLRTRHLPDDRRVLLPVPV